MVGAYPRPSWYTFNFKGRDIKEMLNDARTRELYEDALKVVIKDQELAGIDVVTDGCLRYDDWIAGWGGISWVATRLGGVEWQPEKSTIAKAVISGKPPPVLMDGMWDPVAYGKAVSRVKGDRLQFAEFYKIAQKQTAKPMKFTCSDACLTMFALANSHYKNDEELYFDLCKIYNREFTDLANAGCKVIQVDWALSPVFIAGGKKEDWDRVIEGFNIEAKGVNSRIVLHNCWGRPNNQFAAGKPGSYVEYFKHLAETKADGVEIEAASTAGENLKEDLKSYKEHSSDKNVFVGAVNHRTTLVESPEQVADVIIKASKYVDSGRLGVCGDCGLPALPRSVAYHKVRAITEGTKLARKKI
jgi:5-methyltetrahydropteroyltriglutamate--homocysteine methyltransferase